MTMPNSYDDLIARLRGFSADFHTPQTLDALLRAAADALEAMQAALKPFADTDLTDPFVRDTFGFNVLRARAALQVSGAADPVGQPAGEQTGPVSAAPTLTDEDLADCGLLSEFGQREEAERAAWHEEMRRDAFGL